jgi:citrate lyase subunit beta/citryl-CoA lyase
MRSLLFTPADQPRSVERALACGADAVVLDLQAVAAPARRAVARDLVRATLSAQPVSAAGPRLFVRVAALDSREIDDDLAALSERLPTGVVLSGCACGADVQRLAVRLAVIEAETGTSDGATEVLAITAGTGLAVLQLSSFAPPSRRLIGLAWDGAALLEDLGANCGRALVDCPSDPLRMARALVLFAAAAAGTDAYDAGCSPMRGDEALRVECERAARDGFAGKLALHPDQIPIIHAAFTPSLEAIERARAIVDAFASAPDAESLSVEGRSVGRSSLRRAERTLRGGGPERQPSTANVQVSETGRPSQVS